jgi:hypothetical protein
MISFSKTTRIAGLGLFLVLPLGCTPFDRAVMDGAAPDGDAASATGGDAHGGVGGAGGTSAAGAGGSTGMTIDGGGAGSPSDAQVDVADVGSEPDAAKSEGGSPDGMAAADVPVTVDTAPAGELGSVCGADGACKSGHCVGGVCCNTTCLAGCTSCRAVETGAAEGTCAAVKVGLAHANDCATTTTTSCGTDGKCDGKGACRKWIAGTTCGTTSCASGTSTAMATPTCDGSGTCSPGASKSCGTYLCSSAAGACGTTCSGITDCTSSSYCNDAKACVAKKASGQTCLAGPECLSGACGGRCCSSGTACSCPQPNSQNLIQNAGFDRDLLGWTIVGNAETVSWSSTDSSDCSFSGAVRFTAPVGYGSGAISQCVLLEPAKTYNVGARFRGQSGTMTCLFDAFASQGCMGTPTTISGDTWINSAWSSSFSASVTGKASVRAECFLLENLNFTSEGFVDTVFVSPDPYQY